MPETQQPLPESIDSEDFIEIDGETKADTTDVASEPKPVRREKRRKHSDTEIDLRFTSCGRCGLFISSYRINHNQEYLSALNEIEADWLMLPWHYAMRDLVEKSFGCPSDIASYFFEGSCPECQRPFSYAELDPEQPALFLIKL